MSNLSEVPGTAFIIVLVILGIGYLFYFQRARNIRAVPTPVPIPDDIKRRVIKLYPNQQEQNEVMKVIHAFHEGTIMLNVAPSQFCRAILTLANNDIDELRRLADVPDDPRDIIMIAEAKIGNPKHYFIPPFDDP